jgi:hypothetical protein
MYVSFCTFAPVSSFFNFIFCYLGFCYIISYYTVVLMLGRDWPRMVVVKHKKQWTELLLFLLFILLLLLT